MMKKDAHPAYHEITVKRPSGETFTTRSTYGEPGATLALDIDPATHPAWNKGMQAVARGGQVSRFAKRYEGLGKATAQDAKKADAEKEAAKAAG